MQSIKAKIIFILCFCALSTKLTTAQYFSLYPDSAYGLYRYQSNTQKCKGDSCFVFFRSDSVTFQNNVKTVYLQRKVSTDSSISGTCTLSTQDTTWLGHKVKLVPQSRNKFYNKYGQKLEFQHLKPPGDSFKVTDIKYGGYIYAYIDTQTTNYKFNNRSLNVRRMHFQAKGSDGNDTSHIINDQKIVYSFFFGMIKGLNMYHFPYDTTTYDLHGLTKINVNNGKIRWKTNNPNAFDYINFLNGQEWHYKTVDTNSNDTSSIVIEKKMVIDKKKFGNVDSVRYKFFRSKVSILSFEGKQDTFYSIDTFQKIYAIKNYKFLNLGSKESFIDGAIGTGYIEVSSHEQFNNRLQKTAKNYFTYDSANKCLVEDSVNDEIVKYLEGVGLIFSNSNISKKSYDYKKLIYYQRGLETWGNPYNFNKVTSVKNQLSLSNKIALYPNPVENQLNIVIKNQKVENDILITLYDIIGRKLFSKKLKGNIKNFKIPFNNKSSGIYLLRISSEDSSFKTHVQKVIKK